MHQRKWLNITLAFYIEPIRPFKKSQEQLRHKVFFRQTVCMHKEQYYRTLQKHIKILTVRLWLWLWEPDRWAPWLHCAQRGSAWKATEMDSVMVDGGVLKWPRRATDRPRGSPSQGHVSLAQSDLVADPETGEQRCCFHGWVESARGQAPVLTLPLSEGISSIQAASGRQKIPPTHSAAQADACEDAHLILTKLMLLFES